ncbi:MAG: hypothetical protein JSV52_07750 [Candidatus Zixiibacteriota bacterium]|nr:MAG: hypothetical protein JSV52_07750 [candidate division Zixibacteria bacterium]
MESTIATVIVIFVACMVVWGIRTAKRQKEALLQLRTRLGFSRIEDVDEALRNRIASIAKSGKERVRVGKVFKRDEGSCTLYDCQIYSSRNKNNNSRSSVLVIPGVNLPAFRLAPCMVKSGTFAGLMRKATQMALKQGGFSEVDVGSMPDFSAKYLLAAKEPERVRAEIPSSVWREIMALSNYFFMKGESDTIIFSVMDVTAMRGRGGFVKQEEERLSQAVRVASSLAGIFKSTKREASYATWQ